MLVPVCHTCDKPISNLRRDGFCDECADGLEMQSGLPIGEKEERYPVDYEGIYVGPVMDLYNKRMRVTGHDDEGYEVVLVDDPDRTMVVYWNSLN